MDGGNGRQVGLFIGPQDYRIVQPTYEIRQKEHPTKQGSGHDINYFKSPNDVGQ